MDDVQRQALNASLKPRRQPGQGQWIERPPGRVHRGEAEEMVLRMTRLRVRRREYIHLMP